MLRVNEQDGKFVCVGLDPDVDPAAGMLPPALRDCPDKVTSIDELTHGIVNGVGSAAAAFKPNLGFYFRHGTRGIDLLIRLIAHIRTRAPEALVILDCKSGDIDKTAEQYAVAAFETCGADAVTVNPYMGEDAIVPFAKYKDKGVFVLCRTSNPSAARYQDAIQADGQPLYIHVARDMVALNETYGNIGLVVGATSREPVVRVREVAPELPLLIPGFGKKQGGLIADIVPFARPGGHGIFLANLSSDFGKAWQDQFNMSVSKGARAKHSDVEAEIARALIQPARS
jgi:orotidine-5'-phosphate decarboxylase